MPISNLCSDKIITVEKRATLKRAAQLMKEHHVGSLVVVGLSGKNKPLGILTDRDIVLTVVAEGLPFDTPVEEVMSPKVITVHDSDGIAEVADKMQEEGVRRMVVVDDSGLACGMVSSDDILQLMARELNALGNLVQRQLQNEKSYRDTSEQDRPILF